MRDYAVLLRGINVGGKNKIAMSELRSALDVAGFESVRTYIQSGNVVLRSDLDAGPLAATIEALLVQQFVLDSQIVKTLAIERDTYTRIVAGAPKEFGEDNERFRYDVIFLIGMTSTEAMRQIDVREGIDNAWQGNGVVYFRRPAQKSPDATKSYLRKIIQQPIYSSLTIRNWRTAMQLQTMLDASP